MKNAIYLCVTKGNKMVVISCKAIRDFTEKNRDVEDGYNVVEKADFANLAEIKHMFNSVDYVGCNLYVFNIKGNHYRLIARIHFAVRTVYIKFIGTHKEYDRVDLSSL